MLRRIEELDAELQGLFNKIDFPIQESCTLHTIHDFTTVMLQFTNPANELIQSFLKKETSDEFKKEVAELIRKYRKAISDKYNTGVPNPYLPFR